MIFVDDDSTDGTGAELHRLAHARPNVRYLRRIGRRGLASACIEGMLATTAPYLAVMDADLQHDETILLPRMLEIMRDGRADLVIGTRFAEGGERRRAVAERAGWSAGSATLLSRLVVAPSSPTR